MICLLNGSGAQFRWEFCQNTDRLDLAHYRDENIRKQTSQTQNHRCRRYVIIAATSQQVMKNRLIAVPAAASVLLMASAVRAAPEAATHLAGTQEIQPMILIGLRSEERRVGKECRARWVRKR